jgi:class 3 adenylate cyclase
MDTFGMKQELPEGVVTLHLTDIQGSTRSTVHLGDIYPKVLATHCALIRAACDMYSGYEVDTQGTRSLWYFPAQLKKSLRLQQFSLS